MDLKIMYERFMYKIIDYFKFGSLGRLTKLGDEHHEALLKLLN